MSIKSFVEQHTKKSKGKTVVIWRGVGGRDAIHTEAAFALALKLRGFQPQFVMCDRVMSGCIVGKGVGVNRACCNECYSHGVNTLNNYGLSHITFSSLVPRKRRKKFREIVNSIPYNEIESYTFHSVPVGIFASDSLARHLKGASAGPQRHKIFREFLFSSLVCLEAARVYYHRYRPDFAIFQRHFEYVGWGPAYHYFAANKGMRITAWGGSMDLTRQTTMINCGSEYPVLYQVSDKAWEELINTGPTKVESLAVDKHLKLSGISKEALLQRLGISGSNPIWCVFPHAHWDAGLSPLQWPFDNIDDWLFTTIQAMLDTPNITWLLKAHPDERYNTARGTIQIAKERFPELEESFIIIPPKTQIQANDLSLILSGGITLQGSVATELTALGIPMIVGNPKYPRKEFTYSGKTKKDYIELIHKVSEIKPPSPKSQNWARLLLGYMRVREKLPLHVTASSKGYKPIIPEKIHLLLPGKDPVIDMICDRIVHGGEFIL